MLPLLLSWPPTPLLPDVSSSSPASDSWSCAMPVPRTAATFCRPDFVLGVGHTKKNTTCSGRQRRCRIGSKGAVAVPVNWGQDRAGRKGGEGPCCVGQGGPQASSGIRTPNAVSTPQTCSSERGWLLHTETDILEHPQVKREEESGRNGAPPGPLLCPCGW